MRFQEFKIINEAPGDEQPAKSMGGLDTPEPSIEKASAAEIKGLQQSIAGKVTKVGDAAVLHRVESILRKSGINRVASRFFKVDSDASKFITRLSEIIIGLEIPVQEKMNFLREFGQKNMIIADELFDNSGTPKSMNSWFDGSETARLMFKLMINDPRLIGKDAGEAGPGEVAIACFHRGITVGTDPKAGYDLKYGNDLIEIKTKASEKGSGGGGRWTAMNDFPLQTYASGGDSLLDPDKLPPSVSMFGTERKQKNKLPSLVEVLNDPAYLKTNDAIDSKKSDTQSSPIPNLVVPLSDAQQKDVFAKVLKLAYINASNETINNAVSVYPNFTVNDVAPIAFESYKAKQKFTSMMLMKATKDNITSLHFTDLNKATENFKFSNLYVSGQQRGMSLQASLKTRA